MAEIFMFVQKSCPHCILAKRELEKLLKLPRYETLSVRVIDELREPELADSYDYWYVPCFFLGHTKLHEGHAELRDVKQVLETALDRETNDILKSISHS